MENDLIYAGTIIRTRGLKGQMILTETNDDIRKVRDNATIEIGYSKNFVNSYQLERWEWSSAKVMVKIVGIDTKEEAEGFIEKGIFLRRDDILDNEHDYYDDDIIGCSVFDTNDMKIGNIIEIWEMPANDIWLMATENGEVPVPVIDDIIMHVDVKERKITINVIEGLLDLSNNKENEDEN